jgi:hypothetical protein
VSLGKLSIIRFAFLPMVTLGRWRVGPTLFHTLEEPWRADPDGPGGQRREGALMESCIPDGDYALLPHDGAKWRRVWRFESPSKGVYGLPHQVPAGAAYGRSAILAHSGVSVNSILGCVLVGFGHVFQNGRWEVTDSVAALEKLRALLGVGTRHSVTIRPSHGTSEAWL